MAQRGGWWLKSTDHVVSADVSARPAVVRDFYCDLRNVQQVHPLIVSVDVTRRVETDDGHVHTYRIRDRIPFGPVAVGISYTARVHVPNSGDVRTEARQFPRVRLVATVSFDHVGGGTRLTEKLRITAPRPLSAVTARQAVKAHTEMLAGIRQCFR